MSILDHRPLWPADAPNPDVWCSRCQKYHKAHPYTQADEDRYLALAAQHITEAIDRDIEATIIRHLGDKMLVMTRLKEPIS